MINLSMVKAIFRKLIHPCQKEMCKVLLLDLHQHFTEFPEVHQGSCCTIFLTDTQTATKIFL